MEKINILIADDHPVVREGLSSMLSREPNFCVIGEAKDGKEAIEMALKLHPDILLIDLRMPGVDGVEAMKTIRATDSNIKFVILTTYNNDEYIFQGIEAGAQAYLLKDAPREELFNSIKAVYRGESIIQSSIAGKVLDHLRTLSRQVQGPSFFSSREQDVLKQMAKGIPIKEIAINLAISESTVKTHIQNIFVKLGVNNRMAAVSEAIKRGYLGPIE
jgi:DNA-binding NarL/FixJ family response regulator